MFPHSANYRTLDIRVVTCWSFQRTRLLVASWGILLLVATAPTSNNVTAAASVRDTSPIYFTTDVVPILTKLQCNSGGCHGKATGQNGFKLSLLGFEPEMDYLAIAKESQGRRIFPSAPDRSLLLRKATSQIPHGGGRRLDLESDEYHTLSRWIADGARRPTERDPILDRIEIDPSERVLTTDSTQQLQVTAHFSDGTSKDVTRQAVFHSNESKIAEVKSDGLVQTTNHNGLFAIMVRFGGQIATFHGAVPFESAREPRQATVQYRAIRALSPWPFSQLSSVTVNLAPRSP